MRKRHLSEYGTSLQSAASMHGQSVDFDVSPTKRMGFEIGQNKKWECVLIARKDFVTFFSANVCSKIGQEIGQRSCLNLGPRWKASIESSRRISSAFPESIADVVAAISGTAATLDAALHRTTVANLANLVRIMNSYYSNLIEGNDTRPRDIERELAGQLGGASTIETCNARPQRTCACKRPSTNWPCTRRSTSQDRGSS